MQSKFIHRFADKSTRFFTCFLWVFISKQPPGEALFFRRVHQVEKWDFRQTHAKNHPSPVLIIWDYFHLGISIIGTMWKFTPQVRNLVELFLPIRSDSNILLLPPSDPTEENIQITSPGLAGHCEKNKKNLAGHSCWALVSTSPQSLT